MKAVIRKYSLEILSVILFGVVTLTAVMPVVSIPRKILSVLMFLFVLHEWEENVYPGGFSQLMGRFTGVEFTPERLELAHLPVVVLLLVYLLIPYIFDSVPLLTIPIIILCIFECFVHVAGIKIHKMKRPYTPGLLTALCMLAAAIWAIRLLNEAELVRGEDYGLGAVMMLVGFAIMQRTVLAINGFGYKDILKILKSKRKR